MKDCIAPAACDQTLLVSSCTMACSTPADCPVRAAGFPAWTCNGGLCKRPADVFGPLGGGSTPAQYACDGGGNTINICNDAQHIDFDKFSIPNPPSVNCSAPTTTDGVAGDSCADSCRYQGACPFGFVCTGVGNLGGNRVGLCLPFGSTHTGAACSSNVQCEFGYCSAGACSRDCSGDGLCPTGTTCTAVGGAAPTIEGKPFKRCQ
jgi:hypothetical protein